ncbi:MAG TPA: molybdopterin converting factor subunit 1 [Burkholderiales bacterium]|nr:molybdopterin converting factor subunit 1 [Burkholderiales bacterium]
MTLTLLYFARLRETLGTPSERVQPAATVTDVAELLDWLRARGGAWNDELAPSRSLRVAVNQEMADLGTSLTDGDEVALFPPVTGG